MLQNDLLFYRYVSTISLTAFGNNKVFTLPLLRQKKKMERERIRSLLYFPKVYGVIRTGS
jgi:hypothetical protein